MKNKLCILLSVALLGMAVLGGCADSTGESSVDNSNTQAATTESKDNTTPAEVKGNPAVVVGIQQDIDSLDPHKATAAGTKEILFNIFEGLVKPDENGNLINAVASDYTISDDCLVYTFTLRDGVKFHNGNVVTAEDVKYSLDRASGLLDGTPIISALKVLTSVDIIDEKTVQVTVGSANPELIYSFTAAIIPAGSGEDENAQPIGTGPFCFVSYVPQEGIKIAKNADYWQAGLPKVDEVEFKIVSSTDTAMMQLQAGEIDVYPYLTDSQVAALSGSSNVLSSASDVVQALFLNNDYEPLQNEKVRQAVLYALDRDSVNGFVSGGLGTIISAPMLPTLKDFYVDLNSNYGTAGNVQKAKELLTEAGYPNGFDLAIMVPSNYDFHMETAEVVVEQLKAAGINATIDPVEWETWLSDCYNNRQYQATICGITGDMTPGYLMNRFVSNSKKNFINFKSEAFDAEYAKLDGLIDLSKRAEIYKELEKIMVDEAATAFIQVPPINVYVSDRIAGYVFYPVYVQDMSTVYFK